MIDIAQSLRKTAALAGLVGVAAASFSGCGGGGGSASGGGGGGGGTGGNGGSLLGSGFSGRAVCAANPTKTGKANWTILVYMNAANNLQPFSLLNVAQLASVGSSAGVNVVVQWKQATPADGCSDCEPGITQSPPVPVSFDGTHRYFIKQHSQGDVTAITNGNTTSLEDAGERLPDPSTNINGQSDMGSWQTLANFIQWGTANYPATNLMVVLWDHGSGWLSGPDLGRAAARKGKSRAVSFDDQTNNQIETWQTPQALATAAQPIDVLAIDCSLEQMMEVAYQVKGSAKIFVASEESPPGAGYPYDKILSDITAGAANPCAASQIVVKDFVNAYPQETDITQSAIDLTQMTKAASSVDAFASSLLTHINDQASVIAQARAQARSFDLNAGYTNYDIVDFAQQIINLSGKSDLKTAASNTQIAIAGSSNASSAVMIHQYGASTPVASHGLAIWIPGPGGNFQDYASLQFAIDFPHWNQFLNAQTQ